ncbi:MAG: STAS/SEC14 domain-containing protein [Myxococcota bacterium]
MSDGREFGPRTIVDGQIVIAYRYEVVILVFGVREWTVDVAERLYEESTALTRTNPHTLVRMAGSEPGASVRKRIADLQAELDVRIPSKEERRVAVINDSALIRGAITAMRWLTGDQIRAFASDDVMGAASWTAGEGGNALGVYELYHECNTFNS